MSKIFQEMHDNENRNMLHFSHLLRIVTLGFDEIGLDNRNRFKSDWTIFQARQYLDPNTD